MDITEAKKVIKDEKDASLAELMFAAGEMAMPENWNSVTLLDLIECMKRGNAFKKMTAIDECAAISLYWRTKRPRKSRVPYEDFITDAEDWLRYLKENNFDLNSHGFPPPPEPASPKPTEEGITFRGSISNPWPLKPGQRPALRPGQPYVIVDPDKLPPGSITPDPNEPGKFIV